MASAAVQQPPLSVELSDPRSSVSRYPARISSASSSVLLTTPLESASARSSAYQYTQTNSSSGSTPNAGSTQDSTSAGALHAARSASSTHARLHKRVGSKGSTPNRKHSASLDKLDTSVGRQPPNAFVDSSSDLPRNSTSSKSLPRDRLKALRKLTQSKDGADEQGIDLSLTAAENEERSGLGIITQSPHTPIATIDYPFSTSPVVSQNASFSPVSPQSGSASAFRPTAPYAYPMRPTPRPSTPPIAQSYTLSMMSSDLTGDLYPPMRETSRDATGGSPEPFPDTASFTSSTYKRPVLPNASGSFSRLESGSQTNVSTLSGLSRPRRSTNRSVEATTPPSVGIGERKHSFGFAKKDSVDSEQRKASISAARQAFAEREEAKARKYEQREQRAAERRNRQQQKQNERKRRKSEPDVSTRERRSSQSEQPVVISGPEYRNLRSSSDGTGPVQRGHKGGRSPPLKSGYLSLLTWMKVRMMRMGKKRRQSN